MNVPVPTFIPVPFVPVAIILGVVVETALLLSPIVSIGVSELPIHIPLVDPVISPPVIIISPLLKAIPDAVFAVIFPPVISIVPVESFTTASGL